MRGQLRVQNGARNETSAQRAMAGIWRLVQTQLELALSLAQEEERGGEEPAVRTWPSRRVRQARLARICGTLAEINDQISEALTVEAEGAGGKNADD